MKLKQLIDKDDIQKSGVDLELEVASISSNTNQELNNRVFVALSGTKNDGNEYIEKVLKKGADAFVTDNKDFFEKFSKRGVLVKNARSTLAKMWSKFYNNPAKNMKIIAITGTNGKTSTAHFLYSILKESGIVCGLISTIEIKISKKLIHLDEDTLNNTATMTTPDPEELYKILAMMKAEGVEVVVMEASSHALSLCKLDGLEVDIGVFTNLSREHLDFHTDIEEYFLAKELLFKKCNIGIVNIDDKYGKRLKDRYKCRVFTVSCHEDGDYLASKIICNTKGVKFYAKLEKTRVCIKSKSLGTFTVYNTLVAAACASALGISAKQIKEGIWKTEVIKGRLERYENKNIFIDYAHTPEATKGVLEVLRRAYPNKKMIVLFGCGGDRDKGKRPEVGKICSKYADFSIVTADNSRSENTEDIISDILVGYETKDNFKVILDRTEAIKYGVKMLKKDSVLVLLGKGHEQYEITKDGKIPFDERTVLREIFNK